MKHHIDRRIILNKDSEFRSLYRWSLQELDADGKKVGSDQIPWDWDLYFTASELALIDTITIEPDYQHASEDEKMAVRERQFIRAKLRPGDPRDQGCYNQTSYSMFGTHRKISAFELYIEELRDSDEQERCTVWGNVSYTTDIDFRDISADDCVIFYLYVQSNRFTRYAEKIATSAVDEAGLCVGRVAGFYSHWSPSISTDEIKVLTKNKEHKVEIPSDCGIDPPQLGEVMKVELWFRGVSKLEKPRAEGFEEAEDSTDNGAVPEELADRAGDVQIMQRLTVAVPRALNLLSSMRIAAWSIAGLLLLILIT